MKFSLFSIFFLTSFMHGNSSIGLLSPNIRVLKSNDQIISEPVLLEEMNLVLPPSQINFADISKIVQKVAKSNGFSIESEDSALNTIDYHLSQKFGRTLNLVVNKENNELMHFTLSSDQNELISESQFSTFGANAKDIASLIESSIKEANSENKERELEIIESLNFDNFDKQIIVPSQAKIEWNVIKSEESKTFIFSLQINSNGFKLKVKLDESGPKKCLILDDRSEPENKLSNHLFFKIGLQKEIEKEKLVAIFKEKLDIYKNRHSNLENNSANKSNVTEFFKTYFKNFFCKESDLENGSVFLEFTKSKTEKSVLGSIQILLTPLDFFHIEIVFSNKLLTIYSKSSDFSSQIISLESELQKNFGVLPKNYPDLLKIGEIFAKKLSSQCSKNQKVEFKANAEKTIGFISPDKNNEKACLFYKSDIFLTEYNFGLFGRQKYIHVLLSNSFLQTELIFKIEIEKLEQSISEFVLELLAQLNESKTFFEESNVGEKIDLTSVKSILIEKNFQQIAPNNLEFKNEKGNLLVLIQDAGDYLAIHLLAKKKTVSEGVSFDTSKEVFISKNSTQNEKERIRGIFDMAIEDLGK